MNVQQKFFHRMLLDFWRILPLLITGVLFVVLSLPFAKMVGIPEFGVWGTWFGGTCFAFCLSHIGRRALFPKLDLMELMIQAAKENSVAKAILALAVCIVLAALLLLTGNALKV